MTMAIISYLTRKESFCAAHRLHSMHLTDEENAELYGKCNWPNGHGHNYTVEVTVRGKLNEKTGMVLNISVLKECMKRAIMDIMDHKNLDKDVPFFKTQPSTAEWISVFIWRQMEEALPKTDDYSLYEVKLFETEKNIVVYRGEQ